MSAIKAKNLLGTDGDTADLFALIKEIDERFSEVDAQIKFNREQFHTMKSADPVVAEPYQNCEKYQSDLPRRIHKDMRARLTENRMIMEAQSAKQTETGLSAADKLSVVLTQMWDFNMDRTGVDLQGAIVSHQTIDKYAVLHWGRAADIWPALPKREYMDEHPKVKGGEKDGAEDDRYEKNPGYRDTTDFDDAPYDRVETKEEKRKNRAINKPVREKFASYTDRVLRDQAQAGSPYYFEVVQPGSCRFVEDRSLENGFGMFLTKRLIGRLDYIDSLSRERRKDPEYKDVSVNQADSSVPMYAETDAPDSWLPSSGQFGTKVTLFQLWTRDEVYEVCGSESGEPLHLVTSRTHLWKMPPFALIPAVVTESPDVVYKYEPALQGVYRVKPKFDRIVTLFMLIAEMIATPVWIYESTKDGTPRLASDGKVMKLSRDSAFADTVPSGYTLRRLEWSMDASLMKLVEMLGKELMDAAPSTGQAEVSTGTEPWAIRLQQAQASVEPGMYGGNMTNGVQIAMRSVAADMSLEPEDGGLRAPVAVFAKTKDGKVDYSQVISVEPADIKSLEINVKLSNTSSAEQVTLIQLWKELINDPLVPYDARDFLTEAMNDPNPDETIANYDSRQLFEKYLKPGILRQELARWAGLEAVLGVNGEIVGIGGQQVNPKQVLSSNGQTPLPDPPRPMGQSMPGLSNLNVPENLPVQGRA